MGLNIGIEVISDARGPQGTEAEVTRRFYDYLAGRLPQAAGTFGLGRVHQRTGRGPEQVGWEPVAEWDFDVRLFAHGTAFRGAMGCDTLDPLYEAIFGFILQEFGCNEVRTECRPYYSS